MNKTAAQKVSTAKIPHAALIYEWFVHPTFLRVFTNFYRFNHIYKTLIKLAGNNEYSADKKVTVLDLACGTFWFGRKRLSELGKERTNFFVAGVDISENLINAARKIVQKKGVPTITYDLSVGNAQNCNFSDEKFDEIWLCGALHQIPNQRLTIQEVNRLLKPGGVFYCQTFFESQRPSLQKLQAKMSKLGFEFLNQGLIDELLTIQGLSKLDHKLSGMVGLFACKKQVKSKI